jgi:hypothetical protein
MEVPVYFNVDFAGFQRPIVAKKTLLSLLEFLKIFITSPDPSSLDPLSIVYDDVNPNLHEVNADFRASYYTTGFEAAHCTLLNFRIGLCQCFSSIIL